MKKEFVILLLTVNALFYSCHNAKSQKNDWQERNLKGKVKSMKEITNGEKNDSVIFAFDDKGNEIQWGWNKNKYTYDNNGYKIEVNSNGHMYNKTIFKYDDKGNNIEKTLYSDGSFNEKYIYNYDDKGHEIEENRYDSIGNHVDLKRISKYDEKGNQIESSKYNFDGSLEGKGTYLYDENGNEIESNSYDANGKLWSKTTHKYDKNGNEIEMINYNADGSLVNARTHKYEYDNYGNWIKDIRIFKRNDKVRSLFSKTGQDIVEREIIYY